MKQKYHVKLTEAERQEIRKQIRSKKNSMEIKKRASVLPDLDESNNRIPEPVKRIASKNGINEEVVRKYRKQFNTTGLKSMLTRKKRKTPPVAAKVTGEVEAHIIAVCCSTPPEGRSQWTLQMIADKIVLDGVIESISDETVRRVLKKRNSSLI
jgi:transposase